MFSVIIPLYNKADYIEKAIKSVLNQTFKEFELIIIDDGSTDNGFDIVQTLLARLAPPLGGWGATQQQNQGVSATRNNGVRLAKYDYIAFLDADDWWEPAYLVEMKNLIEEYPHAGIYGSGYFLVKNGEKKKANIGVEEKFKKGLINYFRVYATNLIMPLWTGATVIKKQVFVSERGFNPSLKMGEDFDLWVRIALNYPVAFVNICLADYNQDVELKNRAVGNLHQPMHHVLWNLNEFELIAQSNTELKQLLDNLRVYGFFPYYLKKEYRKKVKEELNRIDWTRQPKRAKLNYSTPVILLKFKMYFFKSGSFLKQKLLKYI